MFCNDCGSKYKNDKSIICLECGVQNKNIPISSLSNTLVIQRSTWTKKETNLYYAFAVFIPFIGIIMGIIGMTNPNNKKEGITMIAVSIVFWLLWYSIVRSM